MKVDLKPADMSGVKLFPHGYVEAQTQVVALNTSRLRLRDWRASDLDDLGRLSSDPEAKAHIPLDLSLGAACLADHVEPWNRFGFGPWAVELKDSGQFIGSISLSFPGHWPAPELTWVLDRHFWNQGLATEGASAALRFAFEDCGLDEVIAVCLPENRRSERVMQKLGMERTPVETCDERAITITQYAMTAERWQAVQR